MSKLVKQEACQLFIEQEIEEALGQDDLNISKKAREMAEWLSKLFGVDISAETIRKRIQRAKLGHMSHPSVSDGDTSEIPNNQTIAKDGTYRGGSREGAGRPTKFSTLVSDEFREALVKEFQEEKKEIREEKKEHRQVEDKIKADIYNQQPPDENIKIWHGDFYELCKDIPDNSVDMVLTDPPYPIEFIHVWSQLGEVAARVLKPSGFLVTYTGHIYLPRVVSDLSKHLDYYWLMSLYHTGANARAHARNMIAEHKPILIYQKPPFKKQETYLSDVVRNDKADKQYHEWGQGELPVEILMNHFSKPNDLILEPFLGGGTTAAVAKRLSRRCIGIDNDLDAVNTTKAMLI